MTETLTYFDLLNACKQPGCPVCRLEQSGVERYLSSLFYESVNDPGVRDRLRRSLGFCHRHAWLVVEARLGLALGVGIIYQDLLETLLERQPRRLVRKGRQKRFFWLGGSSDIPLNLEAVRRVLQADAPCPACEQEQAIAGRALFVLAGSLGDERLVKALEASDGLCLPHLRQALDYLESGEALDILLTITIAHWQKLRHELAELIRKHDYRFRQEGFGQERDAWRRAVALLTGNKIRRSEM
jgi:hypothetical protein